MKKVICVALLLLISFKANAAAVYTQPPSPTGGLLQSSRWDPNGSDFDQYVWDNFTLSSNQAVTEIDWRGGFMFGSGGALIEFTVAIYASILAGEPDVINPPLVRYHAGGNAGQTPAGTFGGITMYDYKFTLPAPFQAVAGTKYWVQIEAIQNGIPSWGIAAGTGGDGRYFRRIAGVGDVSYQAPPGDAAFTLKAVGVPSLDFDGDGKTDIAVYRKNDGAWWIEPSSGAAPYGVGWGGDPSDMPVPGDYDGDGKTDIAVWRPSNGYWYIINSSNATATYTQWGGGNDMPVPRDYDGDGKTDIAVWRPSNGYWYIINSSNATTTYTQWGGGNDMPVPGDYDGDGKTDIAVWRPENGYWYIINSSNATATYTQWGGGNDIPVPGDYDGDGKTDIAVWRPENGYWYIINSSNATATYTQWGGGNDMPVPGDYDGDGKTDIAIWRPSNGYWYIINSSNGTTTYTQWGSFNDIPVSQ